MWCSTDVHSTALSLISLCLLPASLSPSPTVRKTSMSTVQAALTSMAHAGHLLDHSRAPGLESTAIQNPPGGPAPRSVHCTQRKDQGRESVPHTLRTRDTGRNLHQHPGH